MIDRALWKPILPANASMNMEDAFNVQGFDQHPGSIRIKVNEVAVRSGF